MAQVFLKPIAPGHTAGSGPDSPVRRGRGPGERPEFGYWKTELTQDDLGVDSPYNTYRVPACRRARSAARGWTPSSRSSTRRHELPVLRGEAGRLPRLRRDAGRAPAEHRGVPAADEVPRRHRRPGQAVAVAGLPAGRDRRPRAGHRYERWADAGPSGWRRVVQRPARPDRPRRQRDDPAQGSRDPAAGRDSTRWCRRVGAVNTIVNRDGRLHGYNTDVEGFLRALREDGGFDPAGARAPSSPAQAARRAPSSSPWSRRRGVASRSSTARPPRASRLVRGPAAAGRRDRAARAAGRRTPPGWPQLAACRPSGKLYFARHRPATPKRRIRRCRRAHPLRTCSCTTSSTAPPRPAFCRGAGARRARRSAACRC